MSITDDDTLRTDPLGPEGAGQGPRSDHEGHDDSDEPQAPRNLRERLRARRVDNAEEAAAGGKTEKWPIPGYNDELWAEFTYKPGTWDKLKAIGSRAVKSRHPRKELHAAMDTLAFACTNLLVTEDGGQTFEPYDESGEPVGFDDRLADLMDIPIPAKSKAPSRLVVAGVFNNDLAITAMSNKVSEWMQGEDEEVDEDF